MDARIVEAVGRMHVAHITGQMLAKESGYTERGNAAELLHGAEAGAGSEAQGIRRGDRVCVRGFCRC